MDSWWNGWQSLVKDAPTVEDVRTAKEQVREKQFAVMLAFALELVAEHHPELLREVLGKVWEAPEAALKAVEDRTARLMAIVSEAERQAVQARELLRVIHADLDALEARIGGLEYGLERRGK